MNRLVTPEVSGAATSRFDFTVTEAIRLQPSPNLGERVEALEDDPRLDSSAAINLKNTFGFTDFMDFEVSFGPEQATILGLKFQFIGQPTNGAGAGNISLGMRIGYGMIVTGGSLDSDEIQGGGPSRSYILESGYGLIDFMAGYRILAPLLVYGGYFIDDGRYNLKFKSGIVNSFINEVGAEGYSLGAQWQAGSFLVHLSFAKGDFIIEGKGDDKEFLDASLSLGILY